MVEEHGQEHGRGTWLGIMDLVHEDGQGHGQDSDFFMLNGSICVLVFVFMCKLTRDTTNMAKGPYQPKLTQYWRSLWHVH